MAKDPPVNTLITTAGPTPAGPASRDRFDQETSIMGTSPTTLHDFVLDLLSNPAALADFQADAEGTLAAAGLSDISALDVQEVLPLVLDYVPAGSLPALDGTSFNDLPLDAVDATGAIDQLQAVTRQLALSGVSGTSDVNLAAAGALSADANGLQLFGGFSGWGVADTVGSVDASVSGDFSAVGDVAHSLDATLSTASNLSGTATGTLDGSFAGGVTDSLPGVDGLPVPALGGLDVDSLTGVVNGVTGGVTGNLLGQATHNVGGLLDPSHAADALNLNGVSALPDRPLTPENVVDTVEDTGHHAGVGGLLGQVGGVNVPLLGVGLGDVPVVGGGDISDALF